MALCQDQKTISELWRRHSLATNCTILNAQSQKQWHSNDQLFNLYRRHHTSQTEKTSSQHLNITNKNLVCVLPNNYCELLPLLKWSRNSLCNTDVIHIHRAKSFEFFWRLLGWLTLLEQSATVRNATLLGSCSGSFLTVPAVSRTRPPGSGGGAVGSGLQGD